MNQPNSITIILPPANIGKACLMFGICIELSVIQLFPPSLAALIPFLAGLALTVAGMICLWIGHDELPSLPDNHADRRKPLPGELPQTLLRSRRRGPDVDPVWEEAL